VFASADVVADRVANGVLGLRHFIGSKSCKAEKLVHGLRFLGSQEFTEGIGPLVAFSTCDVDRPRRDERDQLVLIDRQRTFIFVVLLKIATEPVREV
jgi:hypothetical protein